MALRYNKNMYRCLLMLTCLWFVACTNLPKGHVDALQVNQAGPDGVSLVAHVRLQSSSDDALPVVRTRWWMDVDGVALFKVDGALPVTVPANGEARLEIPVGLRTRESLSGREFEFVADLWYHPPGEWRRILSDLNFPLPKKRIRATGLFDDEGNPVIAEQ